MNEAAEGAVPQPAGESAGTLLRRAREAAGIHIASLAVSLKVPVRKLEALEEDRYDLLQDTVFVRALASSVCRSLRIDPGPILARLPQNATPSLAHVRDGINAPFRAPGDGPKPGWPDQLTRPVSLAVIGLLVAAVAVIFLPNLQRGGDDASLLPPPPPAAPPVAETTMVPEVPASAPGAAADASPAAAVPAPASVAASAPLVPPPAAAPAMPPAATPAPAPTAATPATAPTAAVAAASAVAARPAASSASAVPPAGASAAAPAASAAVASGVLVFRTRAASWIQVSDARGQSVLRRQVEPGETAAVSGTPPFNVTVGNASATEVQVRGKAFDLGPVARDNVARFEVK